MPDENICSYDEVFVKSIVEEINEIMLEKYNNEETVPLLGLVPKSALPCDSAIWVHIFKTAEVKGKLNRK